MLVIAVFRASTAVAKIDSAYCAESRQLVNKVGRGFFCA
jgi:hypothetical protein